MHSKVITDIQSTDLVLIKCAFSRYKIFAFQMHNSFTVQTFYHKIIKFYSENTKYVQNIYHYKKKITLFLVLTNFF